MAKIFYWVPLFLIAGCVHFSPSKLWPLNSLHMPAMQQLMAVTLTSKEASSKNEFSKYQWVIDSRVDGWTLVVLSSNQRRLGSASIGKGRVNIESHWPLSDSDIRQMAIIFQQAVGNIEHSPMLLNDFVIEEQENVRRIYQKDQLRVKIVYTSLSFEITQIEVDSSEGLARWSMVTDAREVP